VRVASSVINQPFGLGSVLVKPARKYAKDSIHSTHERSNDHNSDQHDDRIAANFWPLRPRNLAHFIANFANVLRWARALFLYLARDSRPGLANRRTLVVYGAHLLHGALLLSVEIHGHSGV